MTMAYISLTEHPGLRLVWIRAVFTATGRWQPSLNTADGDLRQLPVRTGTGMGLNAYFAYTVVIGME